MRPRTIKYFIREAVRSLVVNRLMSIASIFAVASSIFIVAVFYIIGANVGFFVEQLEGTMGLVVFVDEGLSHTEQLRLEGRIRDIPHVADVQFRSRWDALENFRDWIGDNEALIQGLEQDPPWRDSFAVELTSLAYQDDVERALNNMRHLGVAETSSDANIARILTTLSSIVWVVSVVLVVVLGIISIIIITNTIRITVNARKTEINIMKYVGATDWFIRWPFVIEGLLIGLIGGAVPAVICLLGYGRVIRAVASIPELAFIQFLPEDYILLYVFPFSLFLGTIIGLLGSITSVKRHLKV